MYARADICKGGLIYARGVDILPRRDDTSGEPIIVAHYYSVHARQAML